MLRPFVGLIFLFFCLNSAGKPADSFSLPETKEQTESSEPKASVLDGQLEILKDESEQVTFTKKKKRQSFYGYRQSFSGLLGFSQASSVTSNTYNFSYQLPTENNKAWEASIEVQSNGTGLFLCGFKYIFFHLNSFRPFVRGAVAVQSDGKGDLATLLKLENWRGVGTGGFEVLLTAPFSYRLEAGMAQGTSSSAIEVRTGISWGWY